MDVEFDIDDAQEAAIWGFNCGPAAVCAILGKTPNEIRPHLLDFERKRYTNPTLMADILRGLNIQFRRVFEQLGRCHRDALSTPIYPRWGLVRVQWDGPWCNPGVPVRARYRHTHWIASKRNPVAIGTAAPMIFDVNALCIGGWVAWDEWKDELVPWLIRQIDSKANGNWWPTHCWEIVK